MKLNTVKKISHRPAALGPAVPHRHVRHGADRRRRPCEHGRLGRGRAAVHHGRDAQVAAAVPSAAGSSSEKLFSIKDVPATAGATLRPARRKRQGRKTVNGSKETGAGAGKQKSQQRKRHGPARRGAGAAHNRDAGDKLHALRHERHRLPRHTGDRRLQALAPQAAVHHVQDGPADRRAHQVAPTSSARP